MESKKATCSKCGEVCSKEYYKKCDKCFKEDISKLNNTCACGKPCKSFKQCYSCMMKQKKINSFIDSVNKF